jgi:hypothetical protein
MAVDPVVPTPADESRRRFIRDFLALTGWTFLGGAELFRSAPRAVAGDPKNDDKGWGKLKGRILYDGDVPEAKEVDLEKVGVRGDDLKWFTSTGPVLNQEWVVDKRSKAVQWVLVWLLPEDPKGAAMAVHESLKAIDPKKKVVAVDQVPTGYSQHVTALRAGQDLLMKNTGPVTHAFKLDEGFGTPGFNVSMPSKSERLVENLTAERFTGQVTCPPHAWERMWLRVFDHPYFAVTKADGTFELPLAPTGKCRLVVWQETMGFKGGKEGRFGSVVTVEGAAVTDLGDITIKPTS